MVSAMNEVKGGKGSIQNAFGNYLSSCYRNQKQTQAIKEKKRLC